MLRRLVFVLVGLVALALPAGALADGGCPNETIRTQQGSTYLPLCMAYELVSATDSNGQAVEGRFSPDGDHAWLQAVPPFIPGAKTGSYPIVKANRTSAGWQLEDLAERLGNNVYGLDAISEDGLRTVLVRCLTPSPLGCTSSTLFLEAVDWDGARTPLLTATVGPRGAIASVGQSADASRIFVSNLREGEEAPSPLLAEDTHLRGAGLYESHNGQLEFLGYGPHGEVLTCGEALGGKISGTDAVLGMGFEQDGVSADGQTVVFESPDRLSGCPDPVDVYVRRGEHVVDISAPPNGNPDEGARYVGNSRDGNTVYFTSTSQLVAADTDEANDLYAYDVPGETLTQLTSDTDVNQVTVSPNGAYVYFVTPSKVGGEGVEGAENLFAYHAGSFAHIATTSEGLGRFSIGQIESGSSWAPATPDGKVLVFTGQAPLTGQPTGGKQQVFRYNAVDGSLSCVSCPLDGSPATGVAWIAKPKPTSAIRVQSDDGSVLEFQTETSLVPRDTNGRPDVYIWHDGVVSLVSSGNGAAGGEADGMSADGRTVLFHSRDRLAPDVKQDDVKVYAARVDGGFPVPELLPSCLGEACQGSPLGTPEAVRTASSGFQGVGNIEPSLDGVKSAPAKRSVKRCKRGFVRKKVKAKSGASIRCVKQRPIGRAKAGVRRRGR